MVGCEVSCCWRRRKGSNNGAFRFAGVRITFDANLSGDMKRYSADCEFGGSFWVVARREEEEEDLKLGRGAV